MGSVVNNLFYGIQYPGLNSASWVSTNNLGHKVPSGIYFYQIKTGGTTKTNKIMLLK